MFEKIDHLLIIFFTWLSNRFPSLLRIFPFLGKVRPSSRIYIHTRWWFMR